ncbi:MAG: HmuY family protein [Capnocytophaga felis]|nr:HmuY family protein [Capnocytophaga felis]
MKMKFLLSTLALLTLTFFSCKKDDKNELDKPQDGILEYKNLPVAGNNWVYFSFEKNGITTENEEWDIAFRQYDIKTKSGVIKIRERNFNKVTEAPLEGYIVDSERYTFAGRSLVKNVSSYVISMGYSESFWQFITENGIINGIPEGEREAAKTSLVHNNGWQTFSYSQGTKIPVFQNNGWIYIIKMANGNFAKIHLSSFTNDKNAPFFITFRYKISKEGKF